MKDTLLRIETRNGPAWVLPEYNIEFYTTQVTQLLWNVKFYNFNRKGKK
jgi:hypothetical protein